MVLVLRHSIKNRSDSTQVRLVLVWLSIGLEYGVNFANQSQSAVTPNQSNHQITFDSQLKASLYLKATFYVLVSLDRAYAYHLAWVACLDGRFRLGLRLVHEWASDRAHEEDLGSRQIHCLPRRNSGHSFLHSVYHYPVV